MATLQELPPEGQQVIANSLGFQGDMKDFPKYLMANETVANEYSKMEDAFQRQQNRNRIGMAEGGVVQSQEQQGVGAYVPPPEQNFTVLPTVSISLS